MTETLHFLSPLRWSKCVGNLPRGEGQTWSDVWLPLPNDGLRHRYRHLNMLFVHDSHSDWMLVFRVLFYHDETGNCKWLWLSWYPQSPAPPHAEVSWCKTLNTRFLQMACQCLCMEVENIVKRFVAPIKLKSALLMKTCGPRTRTGLWAISVCPATS